MLFNVFLVIFLAVSFLIAFSAIGTCLLRLKAMSSAIDNIHEVQAKMLELTRVTAEYDNKQLLIIEDMAHEITDLKRMVNGLKLEISEGKDLVIQTYDKLLNVSDSLENLGKAVDEYGKTIERNTTPEIPDLEFGAVTIATGGDPIQPTTQSTSSSTSSKTVRKNASKKAKK